MSKVAQRLSSGLRVNGPKDDAAGLIVASRLQSDARLYRQAERNISDGVSLLSITSAAITEPRAGSRLTLAYFK